MSEEITFQVDGSVWERVVEVVQTGLLEDKDISEELRSIKLAPGESDADAADEVWHRVVQIVQESMLTLTNVYDNLSLVRLVEGPDGKLVLSSGYKELVAKMHVAMAQEAQLLKQRATSSAFTVEPS